MSTNPQDRPVFLRLADDEYEVPDGYQPWRIDADGTIWARRSTADLQATPVVDDIDHADTDWPDDDDDDRLDQSDQLPEVASERPQRPTFIQRAMKLIRGIPG